MSRERSARPLGRARQSVVLVASLLAALIWTPALVAMANFDAVAPDAAAVTVATLFVAAVAALARPLWAVAAGIAGAGVVVATGAAFAPGLLALPAIGAGLAWAAGRFGARLPAGIDTAFTGRRGLAVAAALVALLSVVQMGRLSTRMADWDTNFVLTTTNPFWHTHQCLSAYLHGAELASRGEDNIYDASHYPALDRDAAPQTAIEDMVVEDPYQYPPQFLLLPKLALALTHDFALIRQVWFALNVSIFVAAFAGLALWLRSRAGNLALWLLPAVLVSFPMLHSFQFGQFHLTAVALAIGGMLAFEMRRSALGGLFLAAAILGKVFPAVLLVPLLVGGRRREVAWTLGWCVALTGLALAVVGTQPFVAFVEYQLPRLANGAAFAFEQAWPELTDLVVADNQGVFGLARKLGLESAAAAWVGRLYAIALFGVAFWTGRRLRDAGREHSGLLWVALLGLASLASPGAWGDYVPSVAIWLLALMAIRVDEGPRWAVPLALAAVLEFFVLGTMPIGEWAPYGLMVSVSMLGAVAMLAIFASAVITGTRREPQSM